MGKNILNYFSLSIFLLNLINLTGCVSRYRPVATINELAPKEELGELRNWYVQSKESKARESASSHIFWFKPILLPIALVLLTPSLIPAETNLTIEQIGDVAVVKFYEDIQDLIGYTDGALSIDYYVVATSQGQVIDEGGSKLLGVAYNSYKNKKIYYEVRKVFKSKEGKYFHFKMPIVRLNQRNEIIYAFDHSLRVVEIFKRGQIEPPRLRLSRDSGEETEKIDKDFLEDFKNYLRTQEISLTEIPCVDSTECKGVKQKTDQIVD